MIKYPECVPINFKI